LDHAPLKNASREARGPKVYLNYLLFLKGDEETFFLLLEGEGVMRSMTDEVLVLAI